MTNFPRKVIMLCHRIKHKIKTTKVKSANTKTKIIKSQDQDQDLKSGLETKAMPDGQKFLLECRDKLNDVDVRTVAD